MGGLVVCIDIDDSKFNSGFITIDRIEIPSVIMLTLFSSKFNRIAINTQYSYVSRYSANWRRLEVKSINNCALGRGTIFIAKTTSPLFSAFQIMFRPNSNCN